MKTPSLPLRPSPLQLEKHEFLEILLTAGEEEPALSSLPLQVNRELSTHMDDPRRWKVELTVEFGAPEGEKVTAYSGRLRIAGYFCVHEQYPEEKRVQLVEITGASMLYGACREMLANLTARSANGRVSLPSVSFVLPKTAEKPVSHGKTRRSATSRRRTTKR